MAISISDSYFILSLGIIHLREMTYLFAREY